MTQLKKCVSGTFVVSLISLIAANSVFGQVGRAIDSTNYYSHYVDGAGIDGQRLTTDWLREDDAVPVIWEELRKAGYKGISAYQLYQLPDSQLVVLSVHASSPKLGFIYVGGHAGDPVKEHRTNAYWQEENNGIAYSQQYRNANYGGYYNIKVMPNNILILHEDCYWYQYSSSSTYNKKLVGKTIALRILREDIRARIAHMH